MVGKRPFVESSPTKVEEIYNYAREQRIWGPQTYPGEKNSNMRHCVVSCLFASTYETESARLFGGLNELQGFIMHDVRHLPSRIEGQTAWAFQLQDLLSNENGFSCAKLNQCTEEGAEQYICATCCGRYSDH